VNFTVGRQPCWTFREKMETPLGNRHECYGPWDVKEPKPLCGMTVSFCDNCAMDHHEGGWNMCGTRPKEKEETK